MRLPIIWLALLSMLALLRALRTVAAVAAAAAAADSSSDEAQHVQLPRAHMNALLHQQALSHVAFHSNPLKLHLAQLFRSFSSAAAIVGVEWGGEAFTLAEHGFHVYAFEPGAKFVAHLRRVHANNAHWNLSVVPIAATNSSGHSLTLQYHNAQLRETVTAGRVDEHVHEPLAVLSVDIQGDELHVLQGCAKLLSTPPSPRIASLWIEAIACNRKLTPLLSLLDEHYAAFDFVPWGLSASEARGANVSASLRSFAYNGSRPSAHVAYLHWLCEQQKRSFHWLQTDVLLIRRDLLTPAVHSRLASLSALCSPSHPHAARCQLRQLLAAASSAPPPPPHHQQQKQQQSHDEL